MLLNQRAPISQSLWQSGQICSSINTCTRKCSSFKAMDDGHLKNQLLSFPLDSVRELGSHPVTNPMLWDLYEF